MRNTPLRAFAKSSPINKKTGGKGKGYMKPPYKDTVYGKIPYEKKQAYHGFKNFDSIIEQKEDAQGKTTNIKTPKVMKDGSKNRVHYHKKNK